MAAVYVACSDRRRQETVGINRTLSHRLGSDSSISRIPDAGPSVKGEVWSWIPWLADGPCYCRCGVEPNTGPSGRSVGCHESNNCFQSWEVNHREVFDTVSQIFSSAARCCLVFRKRAQCPGDPTPEYSYHDSLAPDRPRTIPSKTDTTVRHSLHVVHR